MSKSLDLILLNVGYSEHNASWNWKNISSPFARIYYVKEGRAQTRINETTYDLEPNHLYLVPPFTTHDNECYGYFSLFYIHLFERTMNKESIFDKYQFPLEVNADSLDLLLTERLVKINPDRYLHDFDPKQYDNPPTFSQYIADNNKMPLYATMETQGILHQLLSTFMEYAKPKVEDKDTRISRCLRYIHENTDKYISITELANIAYITEDHFIRIFKEEMKITPLRYINLKKIEKAQLLLLTTESPVRNIALELSMDNTSYFNRIFKQYTGITPSEYRKEHNKM